MLAPLYTIAILPGLPDLSVVLFVIVAMLVIPAILVGVVLLVVRRRAPGLEEILAEQDADGDSGAGTGAASGIDPEPRRREDE